MISTIKNSLRLLIVSLLSIYMLMSCLKKFDYAKSKNAVKTLEFSNVLQTEALVTGSVITDNGSALTERGICYDTLSNPTTANFKKANAESTLGDFSCLLDGLSPSTKYYARAYATNGLGTAYGSDISFTTRAATIPILSSTTVAASITATTAQTGGVITHRGASDVTSRGVCYSSSIGIPTITGSKTIDGAGIGTFISPLTGLSPNKIYYIRAYAINSLGTGYGDVKTFSTTAATIPEGITTTAMTSVTQTTATGGGIITSDGGAVITSRGICWSNSNSNPTIANLKTNNGTGIGTYTSLMINLTPGTTYYVRAYATNSVGTAYGTVRAFTTSAATIPLGVTTTSISSITLTSASSGGSITGDGGTPITSRGVCWSSITSSPTIVNQKTIDGTGIGTFTSFITGLLPGTTYYVRAYATNSTGTAYGILRSFNTSSATTPVGVTTTAISLITQVSASSGGSITSDGGSTITRRGVCWNSTNPNPTTSNSFTNNGTGIGSFTASLTGLIANTTYYTRAYATNSIGTSYGNTLVFTTNTTTGYVIGGTGPAGGLIFYDKGSYSGGWRYLEASPTDQSVNAAWGCSGSTIGATGTTLGTGLNNTALIVSNCSTAGTAARLCDQYSLNGFADRYLPSYDESLYMYQNLKLIGLGSFSSDYYSTSTELSSTNAYRRYFLNGTIGSNSKSNLYSVRAIRQF